MPIDPANPAVEPDLPPGVPVYSMGAFLASGKSRDKFFGANASPTPPIPVVQPANPFIETAKGLLSRATGGLTKLFGGTEGTGTVATATPAAVGSLADRTRVLEGGLNDLERRSTGFRTSPNIVVAPASGANAANAAFAARQGPTAAEYNAMTPAQRLQYDAYKNLPSAEQQKTPNFYQQMIAGNQGK